MAHMGTTDTGVTVTDIAAQRSVIPKKRRATCNLHDLRLAQESCWSFMAPGMRHCVNEWEFPDILKIITLSLSRSAPSPYSIKQCPFPEKHPHPRPLRYFPHLAHQPHRTPTYHTHIHTEWDLWSFHMSSWTACPMTKASWYFQLSETCSPKESVTSHNNSNFKMYCVYNCKL